MKPALSALLLVVALLAAAWALGGADETTTILYTGAALGKLTPCACSAESDLGGVLRRDTALERLRAEHLEALTVDAGGSFKEATEQGKWAAEAYLRALAAMRYDALALGPGDLMFGRDVFRAAPALPTLASNLTFKTGAPPTFAREFRAPGRSLRVLALIDPPDLYAGAQADVELTPGELLLATPAAEPILTVVLCSMRRERARAIARLPGAAVTINANPNGDLLNDPPFEFVNGRVYAEAAVFGSRIGVLRLARRGGAVIDARNSFVALDRSFADGPRVKPIHEAFLAQTKRLYLDALAGKATFDRETSPYGGAASCRACHAKEFAVWEKSAHARAWAGLQRVGKTFDPECIECHVVGWRQPGGFRSEADSPQLAAVGCEVCHGPGKAHIRAAGKERGGLERSSLRRCQTCHNPERAPAFDPDRGWRQIAH